MVNASPADSLLQSGSVETCYAAEEAVRTAQFISTLSDYRLPLFHNDNEPPKNLSLTGV